MSGRVATVVGARPQFVKAATVSRAFRRLGVPELLIHTGQHHDANMSDIFFEELEMSPPDLHLGISGGSHGVMTGAMIAKLEEAFIETRPAAVLVYGDTNSTVAGALAASKLHIPIVHSEAGLRSFNRRMPEEINRVVTDHVSTLLLCPTRAGIENLRAEGIVSGVHHVGDVMYDAALFAIARSKSPPAILDRLDLVGRRFSVATIHRAENTNDAGRLESLIAFLERSAQGRAIVFPVHPRTRALLDSHGVRTESLKLCEPLGYFDFHGLLATCESVFTDSGGVQKEAYFHRKPCITLREDTEWLETIEAGWNRLWTSSDFAALRREIPEYGTGNAATTTAAIIQTLL